MYYTGTGKASCWARGGVCVHIRYCPDLHFEASVSGCSTNFKVCCKNFRQLPPTVGVLRATNDQDYPEHLEQEKHILLWKLQSLFE